MKRMKWVLILLKKIWGLNIIKYNRRNNRKPKHNKINQISQTNLSTKLLSELFLYNTLKFLKNLLLQQSPLLSNPKDNHFHINTPNTPNSPFLQHFYTFFHPNNLQFHEYIPNTSGKMQNYLYRFSICIHFHEHISNNPTVLVKQQCRFSNT